MTEPTDELDPLYANALPKDAPGAWIREAIEQKRLTAELFGDDDVDDEL
jgi:hypothetical protein